MRPPTTPLVLTILILWCPAVVAEIGGANPVVIDGVSYSIGGKIEVVGRSAKKDGMDLSRGYAIVAAARFGTRPNQDDVHVYLNAADANKEPPAEGQWLRVRGTLVDANASAFPPALSVALDQVEPIEPQPPLPVEFVGRAARFEGIATKGALVRIDEHAIAVGGLDDWPPALLGKRVAVSGTVAKLDPGGAASVRLDRASWRPVDLADQVDQDVTLDGRLWSLNDHWWFSYGGDHRGERLYLTDARDHTFVGDGGDHGRRVRVSGKLVRQDRPSLQQITTKPDRDLVPCYVVRRARVEYLEDQKSWSARFRQLYAQPNTLEDGVPLLVPEAGLQRNLMDSDTRALLYHRRNHEAIDSILRDPTPQALDVVARRMENAELPGAIRLLYAAVLAAANDPRGRKHLFAAVRVDDDDTDHALYCLGAFASMLPRGSAITTDCAWAEAPMLDVLQRVDDAGRHALAERALNVSDILPVLLTIAGPRTRDALIDLAATPEGKRLGLAAHIARARGPLAAEDLLRLLDVLDADRPKQDAGSGKPATGQLDTYAMGLADNARRSILRQLLLQDHPAAVERFEKELEDGFVYTDVRSHLTPRIVAALAARRDRLTGPARQHVDMLLILAAKDPVPTLIELLADPGWPDKNFMFWELARLRDARAIEPVAKLLTDGSLKPVGGALSAGKTVENALEAIAAPATPAACRALVRLFDVDLGRFGGYVDRDGCRRLIAAHLIEITGESFGTDAAAWRKWLDAAKPENQ